MIFFWILWAIDAVAGLVAIYFFFIGLIDGSVSSSNMGLWAFILIFIGALLGGSLYLKSLEHIIIAKILLAMLAIPAFLFALYMLLAIVTSSKWN